MLKMRQISYPTHAVSKKNMSLFVIFHALKQMALRKMLDYQKQYLDEWALKIFIFCPENYKVKVNDSKYKSKVI